MRCMKWVTSPRPDHSEAGPKSEGERAPSARQQIGSAGLGLAKPDGAKSWRLPEPIHTQAERPQVHRPLDPQGGTHSCRCFRRGSSAGTPGPPGMTATPRHPPNTHRSVRGGGVRRQGAIGTHRLNEGSSQPPRPLHRLSVCASRATVRAKPRVA